MALDRIVQILCFEAGIRLIAVGDPDQSIYGFTGAEPALLRSLSNRKDVQSVHLKLNYRCGSEIIQASEIAPGELRGFKSSRKEKSEIFFQLCEDGIESQAEFICRSIIPDALKRHPGRTIGDIAILYQDKNDGNIIADAASKAGFQYIRIDGNNPYQQSPVTYWLEDCASWCAGGWRLGEPKLSHLIRRWLVFNDSIISELDRRVLKGDLVRFLYENRNPNLSLNEWLKAFLKIGLEEALEREFQLSDDRKKVENLQSITAPGNALSAYTVAFFGGLAGSPNHLNLTTRHSSKGLEYDVVILMALEEGRIPFYNASDNDLESREFSF